MNPQTVLSALRRKLTLRFALLASLTVLFGVVIISGAAQSSKKEREIEEKIASHLPIKIKLKKPEKVKDLENDEWLGDLEVEVTNTGTKPIYYLYIALVLPDVTTEDGKGIAYTLRYGRIQLYEPQSPVLPEDVPILPGESAILKVPADRIRAWKAFRAKGKLSNPKKLEFWFQSLNFGDGTGYWTLDGIPYPRKKERSSNAPCRDGNNTLTKAVTNSPPNIFLPFNLTSMSLSSPVSFIPAKFFRRDASNETAPVDICCPGQGPSCLYLRQKAITCICGEVEGSESAPCSDPYGGC